MDDLKARLNKGLNYFWNLPPSKLTPVTWVHFKTYLKLLDEYLNGKRELTVENMTIDDLKEVFK